MIVPGSRGKAEVRYSIISAHPKIMSAVLESWRSSSLTQVRMARDPGSPSSSPVTSSGPHGAWVSKDLPIVKVGVRHCQSRTLTSLMTLNPATTSSARAAGTCWQRGPMTKASSPS